MKCSPKAWVRKVGRWSAENLGPVLLRYAGEAVGYIKEVSENDEFNGKQKFAMVEAMVKAKAKEMGREVRTSAVQWAVQTAFIGLEKLGEELGDVDEAELAEAD